MLTKKRKLLFKVESLTFFCSFGVFLPITLSSCTKKTQDEHDDDIKYRENFFNDVINNSSYCFSFINENNCFSSFDQKKNYSITWKYQKNDVDEFQKQQKLFLKFNYSREFYLKNIGTIFCLPLITKIDKTQVNANIKDLQKKLFKFPNLDNDKKDDNGKEKEIVFKFTKEQIENINKITNFDVGRKEYEMVFIVSIFNKSLSFESIDDLEKQKNNNGMKNVNIFLHLKLEKNNN